MDNIINIPKDYKTKDTIYILEQSIPIPPFVKNSISKYRFIIIDNVIYLQRKCNNCNDFFTVQYFINDALQNTNENNFRYIGPKSGFHNLCIKCDDTSNTTSNLIPNKLSKENNNETQLNLEIDKNLKNYYKILAINNSTTLKKEIINALLHYKNSLDNSCKK
ncbi:hypothetical protein PMY35_01030 [Clostridium tertium]|uniref:hypothetical protein n=1 Tax=Clostridium tertium TaxID=1559 RepID=UPI00232CD37A|nr:hypothetical protein [Clostridium tertium]MDB1946389.1 hypothetical protein [Clostridium tertium]